MKQETVRAFLDALKDNPAAQEILRGTPEPETEEERVRAYAKLAAGLGFDLTGQDLAEYVEETRQRRYESTQDAAARIRELPPEELAEAAGGGDHPECKDTYRDKENCWVSDGCDIVYHYYKHYECHYADRCHNANSSPCGVQQVDKCRNLAPG